MKNLQLALTLKQLYKMKANGYKYTNVKLPDSNKSLLSLAGSLESLCEQAKNCHLCELSKSRSKVLFGEGNSKADIVFVGNAPNASDDATGKLFSGRVGEMLDNMITKVLDISRDDVYVTNIVKCYPAQNRAIFTTEADTCISYLHMQIENIKPKIVVTLGDEAYRYLTNSDIEIMKIHGTIINHGGYIIVPTFDISFLLKNPSYKKDAFDDLIKIKSLLS
jgi:DNA polymerase